MFVPRLMLHYPDPLAAMELQVHLDDPSDGGGGGAAEGGEPEIEPAAGGGPAPSPEGDQKPGDGGKDKAAAIRAAERKRYEAKLKQARTAAISEFLDEIGVDQDELKSWADTRDTAKAEQRKREREYEKLRTEHASMERQLSKMLLESRVIEVAAPIATNPRTVLLHLLDEQKLRVAREGDNGSMVLQILDGHGNVDPDAKLETVVKDFLSRNKELMKPAGGPGAGSRGSGGGGAKPPPKSEHDLLTAQGTRAALAEGFARLSSGTD